ncbi:Preprotein translocase SecF subunit [Synechococcus sp. RCC307]|nr:Preprotein translocase SecF subunit [Synechococcus sp. RCC307]
MTSSSGAILREPRLRINRHRRLCLSITAVLVALSVLGLVLSWLSPIKAPLKPGLDFTGGTSIQVERNCGDRCAELTVQQVQDALPAAAVVQLLDDGQAVSIRSSALSPADSGAFVDALEQVAGPLIATDTQINTIGPVLGKQLLTSSVLALTVSFAAVALYISARYARLYAALALLALAHDVLITSGLFAWLGLFAGVEVNSLFAVALLTLAGYSVNDTVVVFDRIREQQRLLPDLSVEDQVDRAVDGTLTRSIYTSLSTEIPILALILFGGASLQWFAVALFVGIAVGAWSSVAVVPPLLPLMGGRLPQRAATSGVVA